jgi:nucleoside-diphosphate-sugar epimerase
MRLTIVGASGKPAATSSSRPFMPATTSPRWSGTRPGPVRHQRLKLLVADVLDPAATGPAVAGADAVVPVLGPRCSRQASLIIPAGTASILDAMRTAGTSRLVVVSTAPVAGDDHGTTLPTGCWWRRCYADMASMEEATRRSGTDWTILRPPRLTDVPVAGQNPVKHRSEACCPRCSRV